MFGLFENTKDCKLITNALFIYSWLRKQIKRIDLTVFCMCVYLYMSLCLKFLYTNYSYTNSCSFLLSSLRGQISSPRAWRSQHGHEYRRIAASVKSRNLAFRMKFIRLPTTTTVLSIPHPLPSPQFRLLHLQFWLWSLGGIALHFLHIFLFPLNGKYIF